MVVMFDGVDLVRWKTKVNTQFLPLGRKRFALHDYFIPVIFLCKMKAFSITEILMVIAYTSPPMDPLSALMSSN